MRRYKHLRGPDGTFAARPPAVLPRRVAALYCKVYGRTDSHWAGCNEQECAA